ncbi:hypothetical protein BHM03_00061891, partial [Ensete ventricosum]
CGQYQQLGSTKFLQRNGRKVDEKSEGRFFVARSKNLIDLRLFMNQLNGSVPADLGKNSPLVILDLLENLLSGEIPASIYDRGAL